MEHHPTQLLTIDILPAEHPDLQVIKLSGPLTIHNFFDFQELTRKKPYPQVMVVDVSQVPYIDSAALGCFVGLHVSCQGTGRKYALVGVNDRVLNLFEMTRVGAFLVMYDSISDAKAKLL